VYVTEHLYQAAAQQGCREKNKSCLDARCLLGGGPLLRLARFARRRRVQRVGPRRRARGACSLAPLQVGLLLLLLLLLLLGGRGVSRMCL
jgi:hypothetical protein